MTDLIDIEFTLNGRRVNGLAPWRFTLLRWLRENGRAYEVKEGCSEGVCGTCTVLVDGRSMTACTLLAAQVNGADIETSAGLSPAKDTMHPIQEAFNDTGASQCGFCTSGMLMTTCELVRAGKQMTRDEIRHSLHGNLCRCTGYQAIVDAVEHAVNGVGVER